MASYVALLRGIGPTNPNMRNEKLCAVFEGIGFSNVRPVISSGNIVFDSPERDVPGLEAKIEQALSKELDLKNAVIIRSRSQLQQLVKGNLFAKLTHSQQTYLTVTFLKHHLPKNLNTPPIATSKIVKIDLKLDAICAVTDTSSAKTPNFMAWLEKQFGKDITTRTYRTVQRILNKMDGPNQSNA